MKQIIVWQNHYLAEVAKILSEGKTVKVRIDGNSMYPFIHSGVDEVELVSYNASHPLHQWECVFFEWRGHYMIHRYVGKKNENYLMMGDGNLAQIEEIEKQAIKGVLCAIWHMDGSRQDCYEKKWLLKGQYWYKLRKIRRCLIYILRMFESFHKKW
ncbi:MAG: S24/S26 family peptidase [Bacteroides sp.]|nr:S24/S26 family peptidase [Bacteroides sp.]